MLLVILMIFHYVLLFLPLLLDNYNLANVSLLKIKDLIQFLMIRPIRKYIRVILDLLVYMVIPKTHKMLSDSDDFSLRPIISSIGTYNYNLAKFLTELLDPVIPKENCAKDPFSFCEEIQEVSASNYFLVSYDACSLFTSIPLEETIEYSSRTYISK